MIDLQALKREAAIEALRDLVYLGELPGLDHMVEEALADPVQTDRLLANLDKFIKMGRCYD